MALGTTMAGLGGSELTSWPVNSACYCRQRSVFWGPRRHCTVNIGCYLPGLLRQALYGEYRQLLRQASAAKLPQMLRMSGAALPLPPPRPPTPIRLEDVMRNSTVDNNFLYVYVTWSSCWFCGKIRTEITRATASSLRVGSFVHKLTVNLSARNPKMLQCLYSPAVCLHPEPYESMQWRHIPYEIRINIFGTSMDKVFQLVPSFHLHCCHLRASSYWAASSKCFTNSACTGSHYGPQFLQPTYQFSISVWRCCPQRETNRRFDAMALQVEGQCEANYTLKQLLQMY
jgi:hypothetical protein